MKLRVGNDLDGVYYDFGASFNRYLATIGIAPVFASAEPDRWTFFDHIMTPAEFLQHCHDGVEAGVIFRGPARPGSFETLWSIYDAGHDIIVITDRSFGKTPESSQKATLEWWYDENDFPPISEIAFTPDKTSLPTDVFVEDKLENYDALINSGTPCALINRPWNLQDDGRFRIADVTDYPSVIEKIFVPVG